MYARAHRHEDALEIVQEGFLTFYQLPQAWAIAGGETHIFSATLVNEIRMGCTHYFRRLAVG